MKSNQIILRITNERMARLRELIEEDYKTDESLSTYISNLIIAEYKRRKDEEAERKRKTVGRPRKEAESDEKEEEVRNIPHPDQIMNAGVFMTKTEFEMYQAFKNGDYTIE